MSSRWIMAATAACASLLLAACVPGLSDDAGLYFGRNDGSVPMAERQTVEVYISDTAPRYAGIIEDVAREAGGVLGTDGDSRYGGCTTQDEADVDIAWAALDVALIDYDDLRRIVWEGAQRNGFAYSATPDYRTIDEALPSGTRTGILSFLPILRAAASSTLAFIQGACFQLIPMTWIPPTSNCHFLLLKRCSRTSGLLMLLMRTPI